MAGKAGFASYSVEVGTSPAVSFRAELLPVLWKVSS